MVIIMKTKSTTRQKAIGLQAACRKLALKNGGKTRIPSYHEAIEEVQKAEERLKNDGQEPKDRTEAQGNS